MKRSLLSVFALGAMLALGACDVTRDEAEIEPVEGTTPPPAAPVPVPAPIDTTIPDTTTARTDTTATTTGM
jgi:hypothetical protein